MTHYDYIRFQVFSYILDLTYQLHEMETIAVAKGTLLKQTMARGVTWVSRLGGVN